MTPESQGMPSRGRLFKIFTDLGPYFRKQHSTESLFFFDCLEICVDAEKEPEEREFYGWWIELERNEQAFNYVRSDGLYNLAGDWVVETLTAENQPQVDKSFELFIKRLSELIESQTGLKLNEK